MAPAGWRARSPPANPGAEVVGIDTSPVFIARAREHTGDDPQLEFTLADGRELPFDDASFAAVVCHTSLCHIPRPEQVAPVACPDAWLLPFDGDYATTTVAIAEGRPAAGLRRRVLAGRTGAADMVAPTADTRRELSTAEDDCVSSVARA